LCRGDTSTDVLLVRPPGEGPGLPWTAPREGETQWTLAEELVRDSGLPGVDRLYASTLSLDREGRSLGIFVAFVNRADTASPPAASEWMDLRAAGEELTPSWSDALLRVRQRFVAQPPDEALRLR
jgi:hypothetical protein